ncbi:MAG: type II secretion system GspH family protein [Acidobacteria bacterium]|nr:type II secretion system GspH family protein [Acidobacteriota bacterium]MCL5288189.1 type II secretion system GspH family protein [Acidobacteriota bacterium]
MEKIQSSRMMYACFRRAAGFSLVELLVVLSIMLLITAIAMPRFLDAQMKAYEASAVAFLKTLQSNQESYRLAHGFYADNFNDLGMVAQGPAIPEDLFAPEAAPQSASLSELFGPFTVYAAQATQQPPPQTQPPSEKKEKEDEEGVKGDATRKTRKSGGAMGGMSGGSGGSGGSGRPARGGAGGGGTGPRAGRPRGGSGGAGAGSTPTGGGGTGGGVPAGSGGPQTGGGSGGGLSPTPPPAATTNVVLKHNYIFTLTRPTPTTWKCNAAPVRNRGNARYLFMDQTGVMRSRMGNIADGTSQQM